MHTIDRRSLLASTVALTATGLAPSAFAAGPQRPPKASVRPVTEELHGVKVTDPYRWMEDPKDPEWDPYIHGQNAYARQVLGRIPGRDALARDVSHYSAGFAVVAGLVVRGPYIFTEVRPAGANNYKLFVREGVDGKDRLLIDPETLTQGDTHYSMDFWVPSPDGALVAYGISPAGSEDSVLHILETASGKTRSESIDRAQVGAVAWSDDGRAILLNRLKEGTQRGAADRYLDSAVWLHTLGTETGRDAKVLGRGLDPAVPMTDVDIPAVSTRRGSDRALGQVIRGVQNEFELYTTPVSDAFAGSPKWTKACSFDDEVTNLTWRGDDLYLMSHKDAPRFRIFKTSASSPNLKRAQEVVPQSKAVLKDLTAARDAVYIQATEGGLGKVMRLSPEGSLTTLKLPFEGAVSAMAANPEQDGCWFALESWVHPPVICRGHPDGTVSVTGIAPKVSFPTAGYESQEVMVPARDGARVPLSIIYRKGTPRDGSAPLYLQAYGAYGLDIDPAFTPRILAWLDRGGVMAVAHVRGGGELGEDWHKAGQKLTKPNTWRDCIDCAQWLIAHKWTRRSKLAVEGTSAGGIMVGRFLTERPDLLAVAIDRVGDANAMRSEFMVSGPANIPEFGTVTDAEGFKGLREMDALSHVKDGVAYPAVLITTGLNDPRVAPWEGGKFAARLQAATSSGKPVILRVETDAGHGIGSTRKQRDEETADTYAFILWQVGDPRYQPRAKRP